MGGTALFKRLTRIGSGRPSVRNFSKFRVCLLIISTETQWAAWKELGVPIQKEGAAGDSFGAFWVPNNVDQSYRRSYARNAFYDPASNRSNLKLLTGYRVNEVLFTNDLHASGCHNAGAGHSERRLDHYSESCSRGHPLRGMVAYAPDFTTEWIGPEIPP